MKIKGLQVLLCAGVAMGALAGAKPASAFVAVGPEFQVTETCNIPGFGGGCDLGTFKVTNNSSNEYVWGFSVGNPRAAADSTTQTNWSASTCFSYISSSCGFGESNFDYGNNNGSSPAAGDLANDVGPESSSSEFHFGTFGALASPVEVDLVDSQGDVSFQTFATTHAPEPFSAAILGSGLLGLAGVIRRRRRSKS